MIIGTSIKGEGIKETISGEKEVDRYYIRDHLVAKEVYN